MSKREWEGSGNGIFGSCEKTTLEIAPIGAVLRLCLHVDTEFN